MKKTPKPWHRAHACCQGPTCTTPEAPHYAKGLCQRCYRAARYQALVATEEGRKLHQRLTKAAVARHRAKKALDAEPAAR